VRRLGVARRPRPSGAALAHQLTLTVRPHGQRSAAANTRTWGQARTSALAGSSFLRERSRDGVESSSDRWAAFFEADEFVALTPGWPDDPDTVQEANANPQAFADKSIGEVADHFAAIIAELDRPPVVVGHSFGGLITQILPLPISALRSARPVVGIPLNRHKAIPLTYDQFRYAFANAVDEDEAKALYEEFAVPASAEPLFQAVAANLNPWTEDKVDTENPAGAHSCSSQERRITPSPGR
jgi:hypothetical protein